MLFIVGLALLILELESFVLKLCLFILKLGLTIVHIYHSLVAKRWLWSGVFNNVNNAMIATFYDTPVKCITVIGHCAFSEEDLLTVEEYDNEGAAKTGHEKWVKTFEKYLPDELRDVTNDKLYKREFVDHFEEDFD
jgi:hypothetical protein